MRWIQSVSHWVRSLFLKKAVEKELSDEVCFHLERQIEEHVASGMPREEARRAALREFGGVEQVKEECRDARRVNFLENLLLDLRYGLRSLRKSPSFTIFAVSVLALGIAASTAIFSIADTTLFRALPYRDADRLVIVWEDASTYGFPRDTPAPGNFADWKSRNQVFEDMAAVSFGGSFTLIGEGNPEELRGRGATANLFSVLGVSPALGRDFPPDDDVPGAPHVAILIEGRLFDEHDGGGTLPVALINQAMARKCWPGEDPIGRRFKRGAYAQTATWITVAGIVGDVHQAGLEAPARPEMYLPYQQQEFFEPEYLAVRGSSDPMRLAEVVRQQVWAVDKEQAVAGVTPLEDLVDENLAARRMQTSLLGGFGGLALLLVSIGIYAVLSFAVTQRTQEIGVRVALGAQRRDVLRMVLSQGLKLFLIGAALGLIAALALSRAFVHLLYGVSAYDPVSFASVTMLLAGVALLACYVPARRATRVDPLLALRYE